MSVGQSDARVARALSAPTRAAILDRLRSDGAATAKEVAERSGVHPNVARGHLDLLVDAGLASHTWRRNPAGGRPAKAYEAVPVHMEEGTTLVAEMLASLIEATGAAVEPARRIAEATGERLGRRVRPGSEPLSFEEQIPLLLKALSEVSGAVRISERGEDWVEFEDLDCPFKGIAAAHPELACSLDKSLKAGVMTALGAQNVVVEVVTSIAWGDSSCREVVRLRNK
ncbi:MAG: helix-turn-helix domain-containing protein [Actinomycetota bacterium]